MALLFPRKARIVLGLDINATAVNIVELRVIHKQLQLYRFATVPLLPQAIVDNTIKDTAAVIKAIQEAWTQMNTATRHVAIAMPEALAISKMLTIDAHLSAVELVAEIQLEATTVIPFSLDEVCMDFSVLGENEKDPSKIEVLLVAARKAQVDARCELISAAGLNVEYVDEETFVIERAMQCMLPKEATETIALIHFNVNLITFRVIQKKRVIYTHEEVLTAEPHTEAFLMPLLRRAMQLFLSSEKSHLIERIVLSGADVNDLCNSISEEFSLPARIAAPFQNITLSPAVNVIQLQKTAPTLLVACGLALKGITNHDRD